MTAPATSLRAPTGAHHEHGRHRLALFVIAAAQLMVVLDATIVNIALPSLQRDLGVSATNLAWVVNAYALAFGGLLLLGGRIGDLFGRARVFQLGIGAFSIASLLGGLAPSEGLLIAARVLQGVSAAVIAPTALSLITVTFDEGAERQRAMGVYAAMAGLGSTVGLLLGGVLTDLLDWRWVMFVNVPIGAVVLLGSRVLPRAGDRHGHLDLPGALTGSAGLVALVYGITQAGQHGWTGGLTLGSFAVAAVLLTAFLLVESRTPQPMLPLRLLRDRNRAGANATMLMVGAGMFATFYFLTLYMQQVHGYNPIRTGLAYLPFSLGIMVAAAVLGPRLVARFSPRALIAPGLLVGALGMLWFSRLSPDSSYPGHIMLAMIITPLGLGTAFLPLTLSAVAGTTNRDAGIASALLNSAQQIGGALGLAVLSTISTSAANSRLPDAGAAFLRGAGTHDPGLLTRAAAALTHGYTAAFAAAGALLIAGALVAVATVKAGAPRPDAEHGAEPQPAAV